MPNPGSRPPSPARSAGVEWRNQDGVPAVEKPRGDRTGRCIPQAGRSVGASPGAVARATGRGRPRQPSTVTIRSVETGISSFRNGSGAARIHASVRSFPTVLRSSPTWRQNYYDKG